MEKGGTASLPQMELSVTCSCVSTALDSPLLAAMLSRGGFSPFSRIPHFCWRSVCCDVGWFLLCSLPSSVPSIPTCKRETVAVLACRWHKNWSMTGVMCMHVISALPELKRQRQENCQEGKRLAWATVTIRLQKPKLEENTKQDTNKQTEPTAC